MTPVAPPPGSYAPAPWAPVPPPRHTARNVALAIIAAVVVAFVVLVALTVVGKQTSTSTSTNPTPTSGVAYTDPHTRWSATFAGPPLYHETTTSTALGPIPYLYAEYTGFNVDQVVGVFLLPAGSSFDLQRGIEGLATAANGTLTTTTPGTFQGFPSLEGVVSVHNAGGVLKCQTVKVGDVIYLFGTTGPVDPPSDYAAFVASIHLSPH